MENNTEILYNIKKKLLLKEGNIAYVKFPSSDTLYTGQIININDVSHVSRYGKNPISLRMTQGYTCNFEFDEIIKIEENAFNKHMRSKI